MVTTRTGATRWTAPVRRLVAAGWLFAAGATLHTIDHLRRGQGSVTDELYWLGNVALVVQAVVLTLVLSRHPRAPHAAAAAGFPLAVGFFLAHWLPSWSALSDPVWEVAPMRWFSYAASIAEIVGALAVGVAGLLALLELRRNAVDTWPHSASADAPT